MRSSGNRNSAINEIGTRLGCRLTAVTAII